jgi:30S ribosomal protein S31
MGKGDRRTRRGKLFRGTFGKTRSQKTGATAAVAASTAAPKKKSAKKKKED